MNREDEDTTIANVRLRQCRAPIGQGACGYDMLQNQSFVHVEEGLEAYKTYGCENKKCKSIIQCVIFIRNLAYVYVRMNRSSGNILGICHVSNDCQFLFMASPGFY